MEPQYSGPSPAIPASWPVGDPYLAQAEVGLPGLTYRQVFQDPRLQTLIAQALANNRDLMVAAAEHRRRARAISDPARQPIADVNAGGAARRCGAPRTTMSRELLGRRRRPEFRARPVRPRALADPCRS